MADLALELEQLSTDYPIALLPVRIETRFFQNPPELRIRVYPDEIFADSHRPAPTTAEWQAALAYWTTGWAPAAELDAWRALTTQYPPERAAWLVAVSTPTNLAERPAQAPVFPQVELKDDLLPDVRAAALPRAWTVIAYNGGAEVQRVTGRDIVEPIALSFAPSVAADDPSIVAVDELKIERELLWAVDYAEAEQVGMAVTMPLTPADLASGFDRVIVLGVRTQTSEVDGAELLAELVRAHRYTRGVGLVAQGTPTNNTATAPAGYPPPEDPVARYAVERGDTTVVPGSDGQALSVALGLPTKPAPLDHVDGVRRTEQARAAAMNVALWPCTLGYYLEQMMAPLLTAPQIAEVRAHFRDFVRGRGPLPLARIGRVPYGILPATSIEAWETSDSPSGPDDFGPWLDAGLASLLRAWRQAFLARIPGVPHVGASADPDADLLGVLARDAQSRELRSRAVHGPALVRNLMVLLGGSMTALDQARPTLIAQALADAGLTGLAPRMTQMTLADRALRIGRSLVSTAPLSEVADLDPNYIDEIRTATVAELRLAGGAGEPAFSNPLLYHLLRHATLVELTRVGTSVAVVAGVADAIDQVERELHRIGPGTEGRLTAWERLDAPIAGVTGGESLGSWLGDPSSTDTRRATVREHRAALATLAEVPTAELARLLVETLDTCSHRLDAWLTSLATRRLAAMRATQGQGVYLGAFAWVENLRPQSAPRPGTAGGFIHAPSAAHATTAAVLRNAHLTRVGTMRDEAAVELSSTRVRGALDLLDGVRQGLPLGALLGFRLERALHDRGLDTYIADVRERFPLGRDPGAPLPGANERIAARNVADGLAVRTAIAGATTAGELPWSTVLAFVAPSHQGDVAQILFALDHDVDAVADLLLAESVHQTVQGKTERAAATLASLAGGGAIPDPEVARTPRRGTSVTHRVGFLLGGLPAPTWPETPRAGAEPRLTAWVAQRLPDPTLVQCQISYLLNAPDGSHPRVTTWMTLAELGLGPLDVVALARATDRAGRGELDARLRAYIATTLGARQDVEISHERHPEIAVVSFPDLLELARVLDDALRHARPMTAADLAPIGADVPAGIDAAEVTARADATVGALAMTQANLAAALAIPDVENSSMAAAEVRAALWAVAAYGVRSAVPRGVDDDDPVERAALIRAGQSALAEVARRLAACASAATSTTCLQAAFGGDLTVLPTFVLDNAAEVDAALAHGPTLVGEPRAVRRWLEGAAAVREPLAALRLASLVSEALTTTAPIEPQVVQVPHDPDRPWAGGTFAAAGLRPRSDTVSLVLELPFGASGVLAGMVIDEWSELIPAAAQDTCFAIHHDAPGAEAAQCILLAVPPATKSGAWNLPHLEAILHETLDLAKIRAVDAEQLGPLGLLAPTTILAANLGDDTIGHDLSVHTIDEDAVLTPE
ncbi:MAG: hypothetical protein IPL61_30160 [Myxococcales bacterium]|nr:hypothetical protein [Myxococcales bacterium]